MDDHRTVRVVGWSGPWDDNDPDANFKADVARFAPLEPLTTVENLGRALDIPVGGLCHYVIARWATEGSAALLEIGPSMVRRLASICAEAEGVGSDEARLDAYGKLRSLISWLEYPLDHPDVYEGGDQSPDRS